MLGSDSGRGFRIDVTNMVSTFYGNLVRFYEEVWNLIGYLFKMITSIF